MWFEPCKFELFVDHPDGNVLQAIRGVGLGLGERCGQKSGAGQPGTQLRLPGEWEGGRGRAPCTVSSGGQALTIFSPMSHRTQHNGQHKNSHLHPRWVSEGVHKSLRPRRRSQKSVDVRKTERNCFQGQRGQQPPAWVRAGNPDLYLGMRRDGKSGLVTWRRWSQGQCPVGVESDLQSGAKSGRY